MRNGGKALDRQKYLQQINRVVSEGKFHDTWESLSQYEIPKWYLGAKFGIFIHWGVYSVPAFGSEWYSRSMYLKGTKEFEHHREVYGSQKRFGYKDFIPMFRAERFDPEEWAELFRQAGARYVVPVAEHHDGFQMYKSELSHFNAYEMGPHRDVAGELKIALENRGLEYGASSHRVEHWFFMGHGKEFDSDIREPLKLGDLYWPSMPEGEILDLFSKPEPSAEFLEDWLLRTCEIVDSYRPKLIYFDWWIQHSAVKPYLRKFAAYYYNRAEEWGTGAVINYKYDAFPFGCAVLDMERGQFSEAKPYFWQTDTSVARNSWGYTQGNDYKPVGEILCTLADAVSKNGCLLLNIGPKADGTIPDEDRDILLGIGDWLSTNGEAIYGTQVWRVSEEGPTKAAGGQFSDEKGTAYSSEDIRFTAKGPNVYAIVLRAPEDGVVRIRSLADRDAQKTPCFHGIIRDVSVLGHSDKPEWERSSDSLTVKMGKARDDRPVVVKITVD